MPTTLTVQDEIDFLGTLPTFTNADGTDGIFEIDNSTGEVEFWLLNNTAGIVTYVVAGTRACYIGFTHDFPDPTSSSEGDRARVPASTLYSSFSWDPRRFNSSTDVVRITLDTTTGVQIAAVRRRRIFELIP